MRSPSIFAVLLFLGELFESERQPLLQQFFQLKFFYLPLQALTVYREILVASKFFWFLALPFPISMTGN